MQKSRRTGGARSGGFPGAAKILAHFDHGASRRRVGLRTEGRAPVREGALLFADSAGGETIGKVTSGGFGPSLNAPVAMGFVPTALSALDTKLFAEVPRPAPIAAAHRRRRHALREKHLQTLRTRK